MAVDLAIVALPSLLVAVLAAWAMLALREPEALRGIATLITGRADTSEQVRTAHAALVPLCVRYDMPGTPAALVAAFDEEDLELATDILLEQNLVITLNAGGATATPEPGQVRLELERLMPSGLRLVSFYGVGALYFSWFASRRRGATPGKRVAGIRVVRLDGERLSLLVAFERFVGYAQIPASLLTALLDFWRDPNRRLPHDRLAGTVVVRRDTPLREAGH
jgi:uncharacterized RDD family membrane protein YckC